MTRLWITLLLLLSACPAVQSQLPWETTQPKRELRAVWLTTLNGLDWPRTKASSSRTAEQQKAELCRMLDQLQACHINTIFLQTRIRGTVIYPSRLEPWDFCLTGTYDKSPGYDPLAFAIQEVHRRGMELHAWVVTIPVFKVEAAKQLGKRSLLYTHPELLRRHNGQYYLDPGLPGTADYLSAIISDFIDKYDIDGIHFDYMRYPENAKQFPDQQTYKKYGNGVPLATWRRNNITAIVRRLYREAKARKPWLVMSSSPVGKYRDVRRYSSRGWNAYNAVNQDAQGWLREGIQDVLFPMMYFTGDHFYPFAADWKEGSYGRFVAPGLGIYFLSPSERNWPLSEVTHQLHYLRQQELAGQAFFRARFLLDNHKGLYDYLRDQFYPYPALPPRYIWTDSIAPQPPTNFTEEALEGQMMRLRWESADATSQGGLRYNVYASKTLPVDTTAENLVAMLLPEPVYTYNRFTLLLNRLHLAITAVDRSGNESAATPYP